MQPRKSQRHVNAARSRWRAADLRAQERREAGIPDRPALPDLRQPFQLLLRSAGYRDLHIEPRLGYVSWRAMDAETGEVLHCAALKELLRWIARKLPRTLAVSNFH